MGASPGWSASGLPWSHLVPPPPRPPTDDNRDPSKDAGAGTSATGGAHAVRHIFQVCRHGSRAMAHGTLSCYFHAADERPDAQTCRGFPKSSSQEDAGSDLNPGSGGPGLRVLQSSPAEPRVLVAGWRASLAAWLQQGLTFLEGLSGASEMLPASGPGWDGGFAQLGQPGARTTIAGSQHL